MILIPFIPLYSFQHAYKEHNDYYNFKKLLKNKKRNKSPLGFVTLNANQDVLWKNRAAIWEVSWSGELKCNSRSARAKSPFTLLRLSFSTWNMGIETTSDCTFREEQMRSPKWDSSVDWRVLSRFPLSWSAFKLYISFNKISFNKNLMSAYKVSDCHLSRNLRAHFR